MNATRWYSLRKTLFWWLTSGFFVSWVLLMAVIYAEAQNELEVIHQWEERYQQRSDENRWYEEIDRGKLQEELDEHFVWVLLFPLVVTFPIFGGWIWWVTARGVYPLEILAKEIAHRSPDRLDPLVPELAPSEIRPLIAALNHLFGRLQRAYDNEKAFTADAAHELRTPLAAIIAQAQVAQKAQDGKEQTQALTQLLKSAKQASHLVDQLLCLARLDSLHQLNITKVRLDVLAEEVCAQLAPAAIDKGIVFGLTCSGVTTVEGDATLLAVLLRNLIDNAIRYTPAGGTVEVTVVDQRLEVADNGPGIPIEHRLLVLRRFQRLAGQEISGSGLGLAIVARIAQLHRATLAFSEGLADRGLRVVVRFPTTNEVVKIPGWG